VTVDGIDTELVVSDRSLIRTPGPARARVAAPVNTAKCWDSTFS